MTFERKLQDREGDSHMHVQRRSVPGQKGASTEALLQGCVQCAPEINRQGTSSGGSKDVTDSLSNFQVRNKDLFKY